jgi:c-di-GMP-binding flagellar brake protein YcgR
MRERKMEKHALGNAPDLHDLNPGKKMGVLAIEKRRHPRYSVELPLEYSLTNGKETYGGIVANASEGGLLVYLPEVMRIGDFLKIEIFYANGLELNSIKAVAKVVWYDLAAKESWGEHRYGLQFESIEEKDLERLKTLLREIGK